MIGPLLNALQDELRRIWCYRWLATAVGGTVFTGAAAYAVLAPPVYEAWAQVVVNRETPLTAATQGVSLVGENYGSPYVVQKTLLNEENLAQVARRLAPGVTDENQIAAIAARLRTHIRIPPDAGDGFVEIHYTDSDPWRAQAATQALLDQFIAGNLQRSTRDLGRAGQFLDEQIASYEQLLAQSQARLAEFRRAYPIVVAVPAAPEQTVVNLAPEPAAPPPAPSAASVAREQVAQLEARLANLLTTYTDAYPDVVSTRRQLEDARAQLAAEPEPVAAPTPRPRPAQQMVRRMQVPPAPHPEIAARWADLQRSDEVLRTTYQQLLAKRAAAEMSQAVYGADRAGKYQVTRAPALPTAPRGPNRKLYLAIGAVLALGAGLGAAYLLAAIRGILVSRREVEELFDLPVIGTVSWAPAWRSRAQRLRAFTGRIGPASGPQPARRGPSPLRLNFRIGGVS